MSISPVDITILTCTYNRAGDLEQFLDTAVTQDTGGAFTYEILIVDNASTDGTRLVAEAFMQRHPQLVRYLFEPRQGKAFALNTGLEHARGRYYVIGDDDLLYDPGYLRSIMEAFAAYPDVSVVSGRVTPAWKAPPPRWLDRRHWAAIAMMDLEVDTLIADRNHPACLLAAAYNRAHVRDVGGYNHELGVAGGRVGGVEDDDVLKRLYAAGRRGVYLSRIEVRHKVEPGRMTRAYHRRWHRDHGRQYALMRDPATESSRVHLFGVPGHLYRAAAQDLIAWLRAVLRGSQEYAFWHETRLCFFSGFFRQRVTDWFSRGTDTRAAAA